MLLEEGECEKIMEHLALMRRIEQNSGNDICQN